MPTENGSGSLFQLVYVSAAAVPFDDCSLDELLSVARRNNEPLGVTGVLLFTEQTFFQVLEGPAEAVEALYAKIEEDPRHNNVLVIAQREIERRNFGDWSMGFVRDRSEIVELPGFVDFFSDGPDGPSFLDLQGDAKRIRQILDSFRRGRWRREAAAP